MDKELEKLIEDIGVIIGFYSSLGADFKDIDRLITGKRKLVGYSFRLSEFVGSALQDFKDASNARKHHNANARLKLVEDGNTGTKAELLAEKESWDYRVSEARTEAIYRKLKGFQDAVRDCISSITQDVSTLKAEFENSKNHA